MAKRLFLLLFVSLIGVISTPSFLTATDSVDVIRVDDSKAVETVIPPEPEPEPEPEPAPEPEPEPVAAAPAAGVAETKRVRNYNVTIVKAAKDIVATNLSYYDIYRSGKFIYAHNSANLLGNLGSLSYGEIFTITEFGVTRSYQVMDKVVYEKAANGYLNGSIDLTKDVEWYANGYDISMMTCYGTVYGNGDASHRLVVFANEI